MGNGESTAKAATSVGIGAGLAITTFFCPPLGATLATTAVYTGVGTYGLGKVTGNEEMAEAGKIVFAGAVGSNKCTRLCPKHCPK